MLDKKYQIASFALKEAQIKAKEFFFKLAIRWQFFKHILILFDDFFLPIPIFLPCVWHVGVRVHFNEFYQEGSHVLLLLSALVPPLLGGEGRVVTVKNHLVYGSLQPCADSSTCQSSLALTVLWTCYDFQWMN